MPDATETNPYSSPSETMHGRPINPRWLCWTLVLNAALLVIPALILIATFMWTRSGTTYEENVLTGDPILHQHYFWIQIEYTPLIVYFAVPNLILAAAYISWNIRKRNLGNVV